MTELVEISPWAFDTILDSKLIVTTKPKLYDIKLVRCGDYIHVYFYQNKKVKRNQKDKDSDLNLINITSDKTDNKNIINLVPNIDMKNIIRSKLQCQRIAKSNMTDWETFITLTFGENITDINYANKRFRYFIDKVKRVKKDFKYIAIPEFQKRGAVHYHLLTNIKIDDTSLIYSQENNSKFKHIKYWIDGFTSIEVMKGDPKKVTGYISKYMTKDIDNRLFNRHRYFYSRNLITPIVDFIDTSNSKELDFYNKIIQEAKLIYQNKYADTFNDTEVSFLEYLNK